MNLLTDAWVPVAKNGEAHQVRLEEVLCSDRDFILSHPRDDMEFACLQLLVCLVQTVFLPPDADALLASEAEPMTPDAYARGIAPSIDWFDLRHEKWPFMQTLGVKAKEPTPIQKLFNGLPEGNNHAFFNEVGEVSRACPSCAAVALFNQASNCPNFGGGFKGSLRGQAPITSLVKGATLRQTLWLNALHALSCAERGLRVDDSDVPVWVAPIGRNDEIQTAEIGLRRGLFWQPAHLFMNWRDENAHCDACGQEASAFTITFAKEKFPYKLLGSGWPHPHSCSTWQMKKGERIEHFASFTTTAPAWTRLPSMLHARHMEKEGSMPAAVIEEFGANHPAHRLHLIIGGYRNKQANIIERRHETITIAEGWRKHTAQLASLLERASIICTTLRAKTYGFAREAAAKGLPRAAESLFYQRSEGIIHGLLRSMDFRQFKESFDRMTDDLIGLARSIFAEVVEPYSHTPKGLRTRCRSQRTLEAALSKIRKGG